MKLFRTDSLLSDFIKPFIWGALSYIPRIRPLLLNGFNSKRLQGRVTSPIVEEIVEEKNEPESKPTSVEEKSPIVEEKLSIPKVVETPLVHKGLVNVGNTCFFNSIYQAFFNNDKFFNDLKKENDYFSDNKNLFKLQKAADSPHKTEAEQKTAQWKCDNFLALRPKVQEKYENFLAFRKLYNEADQSSLETQVEMQRIIRNLLGPDMLIGRQHDAEEAYNHLTSDLPNSSIICKRSLQVPDHCRLIEGATSEEINPLRQIKLGLQDAQAGQPLEQLLKNGFMLHKNPGFDQKKYKSLLRDSMSYLLEKKPMPKSLENIPPPQFANLEKEISLLEKGFLIFKTSAENQKLKTLKQELAQQRYKYYESHCKDLCTDGQINREAVDGKIYACSVSEEVRQFDQVPEELVLHLGRFGYSDQGYRYKNNDPFNVPERMQLPSNYFQNNQIPQFYELESFVAHLGEAEAGHYVAFVKEGDKYYLYDDSDRKEVSKTYFLDRASEAYMVKYHLIT